MEYVSPVNPDGMQMDEPADGSSSPVIYAGTSPVVTHMNEGLDEDTLTHSDGGGSVDEPNKRRKLVQRILRDLSTAVAGMEEYNGTTYIKKNIVKSGLLEQPHILECNKRVKRLLRGRVIQRYALAFGLHSLVNANSIEEFVADTAQTLDAEQLRVITVEQDDEREKMKAKADVMDLIERYASAVKQNNAETAAIIRIHAETKADLDNFVLSNVEESDALPECEENALARSELEQIQSQLSALREECEKLETEELPNLAKELENARESNRKMTLSTAALTASVSSSIKGLLDAGLTVLDQGVPQSTSDYTDEQLIDLLMNGEESLKATEANLKKEIGMQMAFSNLIAPPRIDGETDEVHGQETISLVLRPNRRVANIVNSAAKPTQWNGKNAPCDDPIASAFSVESRTAGPAEVPMKESIDVTVDHNFNHPRVVKICIPDCIAEERVNILQIELDLLCRKDDFPSSECILQRTRENDRYVLSGINAHVADVHMAISDFIVSSLSESDEQDGNQTPASVNHLDHLAGAPLQVM